MVISNIDLLNELYKCVFIVYASDGCIYVHWALLIAAGIVTGG